MDWISSTDTPAQEEAKRQAWLNERRTGIGSSDAPTIMGVSPWRTLHDLWLDKTGQIKPEDEFKGNWATERGNRLEPQVRKWYNEKHHSAMLVESAVSPANKLFRASFDGIDHSLRRVIEIKCPGKEDHEAALRGKIPDKYYPQCQWLLMVSGYTELDYVSYSEPMDNYAVVRVVPDIEYVATMCKKALEFWGYVEKREKPPGGAEIHVINDPGVEGLLAEYQALTDNLKRLEGRQKELLEQIKAHVPSGEAQCAGFKLQWIERKGNVDYGAIPELEGVDLERYRKKPSTYFTIKRGKE